MNKITKIGVVGCGNISSAYIGNCKKLKNIEIIAAADLDMDKAKAKAEEHGITKVYSVDEMMKDADIDIVLNLTIPQAHTEIALKSLESGKHTYSEKPFALNRQDAQAVLKLAKEKKLLVGTAPDTFLGQGVQTCRKIIDDGSIGQVVAVHAFMMSSGWESWHPAPQFYYQKGGGPMLDMGPYYLTALVSMLGPVASVMGSAKISSPTRTITSEPLKGTKIKVEVPTHVTAILNFASGATGFIVTSFDICCHSMPPIEIYGTKARLNVPDPNGPGGPVNICGHSYDNQMVPFVPGYPRKIRGVGIADMANAIQTGQKHRVSGELAYHVLDIMLAIDESSDSGNAVQIESTVERPARITEKDIAVFGTM